MARRSVGILTRGLALTAILVVAMLAADAPAGPDLPSRLGPAAVAPAAALGAFLGSDASGVAAIDRFAAWLGARVTVGHTYLAGNGWDDIEGPDWVLAPWTAWLRAAPGRLLVLNVPMVVPNEPPLRTGAAASELRRGAAGDYDAHFRALAQRLVDAGAPDTILVPGWEMNGTTYSSRCAPDPSAWVGYWRHIVAAMRSVPGQRFRFDFDPVRGPQAIDWTRCYPGDDVVDIVGMDAYDQRPGSSFGDFVNQPDGLRTQAEFAAAHGKPISFPEWGLYDYGDDPAYIQAMFDWMATHDVVYQTITDYCPHGVWDCTSNPRASARYRALFGTGS
jgi:hypothetical protein